MVCARCGTAPGPHDAFCRVCGLPFAPPPAVRAGVPRPDDDTEVLRRDDIAAYRPPGRAPAPRPAQRPTPPTPPTPPSRPRRSPTGRRRRALASIAVVVVLLAIVWGAVFLVGGRKSDTADTTPGPTRGRLDTATSAPPTTAGSSRATVPSGSASVPSSKNPSSAAALAARKAQAAAIRGLVDRSTQARSSIGIALTAINQCKSVDGAVSRLQDAAGLRRTLNATLSRQPVDKLPGGAALRSALSRAFTQSAAADDDYAAWGTEVRRCTKRPPRTGNYANAGRHDQQATAAKRDFVQRWNVIAAGSGQSTLDPGRI